MIIAKSISMDIVQKGVTPVVDVVQGDKYSRAIGISIYKAGSAWYIPENANVTIGYIKPDGTRGLYDKLPDGTSAYSVHLNVVTVKLAPQMLTVPGTVKSTVIISIGEHEIGTFPIAINVAPNSAFGAVGSEDYYYSSVIGNLDDLKTEEKDNIVAAINEVLRRGADMEEIQMIVDEYLNSYDFGGGTHVGPEAPEDPNVDIWVDTDEEGSVFGCGIHVGAEQPENPNVDIWVDTDEEESSLFVPNPENASPGQIIRVSEVDEKGMPTKWEMANLPEKPGDVGALPLPQGGKVGQYFRVAAVDETGAVTAVEAVDAPKAGSGGPAVPKLVKSITIIEDVKAVYESVADLALKNYRVHLRIPKAEGNYEAALKIDNKYYWLAYTMPRQHGDIDEIIELTQLEDAQLVERTATNVFTAANYGTGTMRTSTKNIVDFMGNSPTELRIGSNVSLAGTVLKIYDLG